jgi:prepilin-type N-terminal cleavage/methylation domain-containing protein
MIVARKHSGFTLVEVLVASVILFSVLASVSLIYRGAILSSEKASNHIAINAEVKQIIAQIEKIVLEKSKGQETHAEGQGKSNAVGYRWQASLERISSAPAKFDPDSGNFVTPPQKYKLWLVNIDLSLNKTTKHYVFYQLGWNDE